MENASKALIIAGAILISILLISVGIMVMNSVNAPISQSMSEADAQAIEMFNSKFTSYSGVQKAAAVKALMTSIASSIGADPDHDIEIVGGVLGDRPGTVQSKLDSRKHYEVEFDHSAEGFINKVTIRVQP